MPSTSSKLMQLLILPKGDTIPGYVICCPFTHIYAEGKTFEIALQQWKDKAKDKFNSIINIPPKDKFLTRKVFYSYTPHAKGNVFFIDFAKDISKKPVLVNTFSLEIKETSDISSLGLLFDEKIFCSPIFEFQEDLTYSLHHSKYNPLSLTPQFIN